MESICSPELGLDLRPIFVPKTISDFLRDSLAIGNVAERASNLEGYIQRLEEELRKIDAFKRELPLCMVLLKDAILHMKEESAKLELPKNPEPVLEEFMPLKNDKKNFGEDKEEGLNCEEKKEKDCKDKKNWMSSVQLWNADDDNSNFNSTTTDLKQNLNAQSHKGNEKRYGLEADQDLFHGRRGIERAFAPFKPHSIGFSSVTAAEERDGVSVRGLSLIKALKQEPNQNSRPNHIQHHHHQISAAAAAAARKQRRCWSPELHRRFVSALQQLGGSQVATPKQIRELMQVDGLTNDEVKSHLQKYRLHTRRISSGSAPASQSGAGLGSLWMSHEHFGESSKGSSSQSGSPQGPFQLGPIGSGSPTTGDESLDDDDENQDAKSEGYCWKGHTHNKLGKKDDV